MTWFWSHESHFQRVADHSKEEEGEINGIDGLDAELCAEDCRKAVALECVFGRSQQLLSSRNLLCFVVIVLLLQAIFVSLAFQAGKHFGQASHSSLSPIPHLSKETVVISEDDVFSHPASPATDEAWASVLPTIRGLITIDNHQSYNLPPGMVGTEGEQIYGLTWTHQYHCLDMLRTEFWKLLRNSSKMVGVEESSDEYDVINLHHHVHCFDYLRQTLMCNMDMTIEYAAKDPETGAWTDHIDGWDIPHKCTSRSEVFEFMTSHAVEVDQSDSDLAASASGDLSSTAKST